MLAFVRGPAPPIAGPDYRTAEVLKALGTTFFSKCYLCETVCSEPQSFHVEHFRGQAAAPELVTTWDNLFPACEGCNLTKPRIDPAGGYLDPCSAADSVEARIKHELDYFGITRAVRPRFLPLDDDPRTINTCELLDRVHNGHNPNTILRTATLRDAIALRSNLLSQEMLEHYRATKVGDPARIFGAETRIRQFVSRTAPYTMLLRASIVAAAEPQFIALFD